MTNFTLNDFSMHMYYGQEILVFDENKTLVFSGYNYQLASVLAKPYLHRHIKSFGNGLNNNVMEIHLMSL